MIFFVSRENFVVKVTFAKGRKKTKKKTPMPDPALRCGMSLPYPSPKFSIARSFDFCNNVEKAYYNEGNYHFLS